MRALVRPFLLLLLLVLCGLGFAVLMSGYIDGVLHFIQAQQHEFNDRMATELRALDETGGLGSLGLLMFIGFAYGVLHAAGPGHGKVVLTSYLLADKGSLKRGLRIAVLAAFMQAVVAVLLVMLLYVVFGLARHQTEQAGLWLEVISFIFVAGLGVRLMLKGSAALRQLPAHIHHDGCGCNHAHIPSPQDLPPGLSWREEAAMVLSIGLRPCSGAIILLVFSCLVGQAAAGIMATFAMALGTACITGLLAIVAVKARHFAIKWLEPASQRAVYAEAVLAIAGGLLVFAVAALFVLAALDGPLYHGQSHGGPVLMRSLK